MSDGWLRPSSCDSSACAELRIGLTDVSVRNSQRPDQTVVFDHAEWAALLADAKAGRFDLEVTDAPEGGAVGGD